MAIVASEHGGYTWTGVHIKLFQMVAQKGALKLEILGLKRSGRSAYSIVKDQYGFKGTRERVLAQLEDKINETKQELGCA